ncbi:MAG: L,D-transpeptidase [Gemmatimonadetes bacterium]|nr:L,D-transpeptidase [Gemmatimonadota bacterium]
MGWRAGAAALCAAWGMALCGVASATAAKVDFGAQKPSHDARHVAQWAIDTGDAAGRPFLVVDKKDARLYVFKPNGQLLAATPVVLGSARGDRSAPGVGQRAQSGWVPPHERTTPAGRFTTHPGRNLDGEHVIWIDYGAALAIHRLRPGKSHQERAASLATPTPHDNRLSLGCVVVPVAFYLNVVQPLLTRSTGVVYVLPEMQSVRDMLGGL